jgi:hypothetical protein
VGPGSLVHVACEVAIFLLNRSNIWDPNPIDYYSCLLGVCIHWLTRLSMTACDSSSWSIGIIERRRWSQTSLCKTVFADGNKTYNFIKLLCYLNWMKSSWQHRDNDVNWLATDSNKLITLYFMRESWLHDRCTWLDYILTKQIRDSIVQGDGSNSTRRHTHGHARN